MIFRQLFDPDSFSLTYLIAGEQVEAKVLNTRIAGKSLEQFVETMNSLNLATPKRIHEAVPASLLGGIKTPD